MGYRHDLPKIKSEKEPTIFNHEAGKWGYLSAFGASLVSFLALWKEYKNLPGAKSAREIPEIMIANPRIRNAGIIAISVGLIGSLIGGNLEKKKQEQEQVEGRVVKTPGYWNKGIISGMFVSSLFNSTAAYVLKKPLSRTVGGILGVGAIVVGSTMRKNELQRDFDRAITLHDQQQAQQPQQQLLQQLVAQQAMPVPNSLLNVGIPATTIDAASAAPETAEEKELEHVLGAVADHQSLPAHHAKHEHPTHEHGHAHKHAAHESHVEKHHAEKAHQTAAPAMG
jgi:hypothetical protein